jgi:CDP-glycerol glycerophosphotransferase
MVHAIFLLVYTALYYFFRIFPVKKNKIFVQSFSGKGYGDNPKYIVEEIVRRNIDCAIVWAVKPGRKETFPPKIKMVPYRSIRAVYEEATAKIWIDNCRKQPYVRKRKNQYYIQTWHGGPSFVLKKIEKDAAMSLTPYYAAQAKHDSLLIDLFLSCERNRKDVYAATFWYNGEILECGSPGDDLFFGENATIKEKVISYFSITKDTGIILYAPTFRNAFDPDVFGLDFQAVLDLLRRTTGREWVFLVRLHPNISEKAGFISYDEKIINATHYFDVQEIVFASDILISDYSGIIIEFAMMQKPAFLFAKDYGAYIHERSFYMDILSMPFPAAMSNAQLLEKIENFNETRYKQEVAAFLEKIGTIDDGNASKRVVDRICKVLNSPS